jgi:PIN domain nuclease of toxin-antitoxin system
MLPLATRRDIHRDPADRFIIATALLTGRQLLTLDGVIAQYPELTGKLA